MRLKRARVTQGGVAGVQWAVDLVMAEGKDSEQRFGPPHHDLASDIDDCFHRSGARKHPVLNLTSWLLLRCVYGKRTIRGTLINLWTKLDVKLRRGCRTYRSVGVFASHTVSPDAL